MKKAFLLAMFVLVLNPLVLMAQPRAAFGELYYDGTVVRTVIPPASMPKTGRDNLYIVPGQMAVAGVAPGDKGYHGGKWAFHLVSWISTAYLLTSEQEILEAAMAGDITIERLPSMDFKCPVQR